jgi:hypothetical protein
MAQEVVGVDVLITAAMIEVMVRVDDDQQTIGDSADGITDVSDPQTGIEQQRPLGSDDQVAVDVTRLRQ